MVSGEIIVKIRVLAPVSAELWMLLHLLYRVSSAYASAPPPPPPEFTYLAGQL
jgi:hypothetical protein